jgi:hypothetical protein
MRTRSRGKIWAFGALSAAALLGLASCYPGEIEDLEELDTVTTLFDPSEDFAANRTYALADSIVHLCTEIDADLNCLTITRAFDDEILDKVEAEMDSLGYTRVSDPDPDDPPDLLLFLSVIAVENKVLVGSYPCDIWGWYYPYGCYYPPTWTAVEYETGTFFLTMVSPDRPSDGRLPIVWTGLVSGVLSGSTVDNRNRVLAGIGQAFAQSSYLDVGGGNP